MKTTIKFEPTDFNTSGQLIIRNSYRGCGDYGFASSVAYKVGYTYIDNTQKPVLISLSDGLTTIFENYDELCENLNSDVEGYRPMNKNEILGVFEYTGNRFSLAVNNDPILKLNL
jgi:hypothetical protein